MSTVRRYLVTGGTSGIGRMCADYLLREGHRVWVTGTRNETVAPTLAAGGFTGGSVCDVADPDAVEVAFSAAYHGCGGLDGVFINAGIDGQGAAAERLSAVEFSRLLSVNVVGSLLCAQAAHRCLDRPGSVVFNASVNATRPEALFADYNASKAAVVSLANTLALEWAAEGLCVTSVCPGYFRTAMTAGYLDDPELGPGLLKRIPLGRFGAAADIGAVVSFLLSGQAPYLTGASIAVAGASNV